jgi:hypothetical protein
MGAAVLVVLVAVVLVEMQVLVEVVAIATHMFCSHLQAQG